MVQKESQYFENCMTSIEIANINILWKCHVPTVIFLESYWITTTGFE